MKEKSKSIIQAVIGAVIMIIGIVLCVNTYVVKGNKAYAFSLLVHNNWCSEYLISGLILITF